MRWPVVAMLAALTSCGSSTPSTSTGPQTAAEKQRQAFEAEGGEEGGGGGKWGAWKYQGDRDDCFYVLGRACFKTEALACKAAKCDADDICDVTGGGPAVVECKASTK